MTTVHVHNCGFANLHAPHVFDVVNPNVPTLVHTVSCSGTLSAFQAKDKK